MTRNRSTYLWVGLVLGVTALWVTANSGVFEVTVQDVEKAGRDKDIQRLLGIFRDKNHPMRAPALRELVAFADAAQVRELVSPVFVGTEDRDLLAAAFSAWPARPDALDIAFEVTAKPGRGAKWLLCVEHVLSRDPQRTVQRTVQFLQEHNARLRSRFASEDNALQELLAGLAALKVPAEAIRLEPECPRGAHLEHDMVNNDTRAMCVTESDGGTRVRNGPLVIWYPSGLRSMWVNHVDGVVTGNVKLWNEAGRPTDEGPLNASGEREGKWTEWREAPGEAGMRTESTGMYVKNLREGTWKTLLNDGLTLEGLVVHDKNEGRWVLRDSDDFVLSETFFKGGVKLKAIGHDKSGRGTRTCTYTAAGKESLLKPAQRPIPGERAAGLALSLRG